MVADIGEPTDDPAEVEAAWASEIDRGARDVLSGQVEGIPLGDDQG